MRLKLENNNIFVTADSHFWHSNIIKYDQRPFTNVEEMNEILIKNWNNVINNNDIVFYLGDLSFGTTEQTKYIVSRLNGKIHFILGNHDRESDILSLDRFESVSDYIFLLVEDEDAKRKYQDIVLMHYPILSWDKAHHGSWHLHGHEHGHLMKNNRNKIYYERKVLDVGSNIHNYSPLSYTEIKAIMSKRIISEHH